MPFFFPNQGYQRRWVPSRPSPLLLQTPLAVLADPPRCPDCLDHHKINTCGVFNLMQGGSVVSNSGSNAEESLGPEFFEDPDLDGMCGLPRESRETPRALIASETAVNVPPCL